MIGVSDTVQLVLMQGLFVTKQIFVLDFITKMSQKWENCQMMTLSKDNEPSTCDVERII